MTRHLDPDRVPGAPPGYRPVSGELGTCDRCGLVADVGNPFAKQVHERFHQALRAMWATAQTSSPPTPPQEAQATTAGRGGVEGANQPTQAGAGHPPVGAATPPGAGEAAPGGGTRRRSRPGDSGRHQRAGEAPGRAGGDAEATEQALFEQRQAVDFDGDRDPGRWAR